MKSAKTAAKKPRPKKRSALTHRLDLLSSQLEEIRAKVKPRFVKHEGAQFLAPLRVYIRPEVVDDPELNKLVATMFKRMLRRLGVPVSTTVRFDDGYFYIDGLEMDPELGFALNLEFFGRETDDKQDPPSSKNAAT